VGYPAGPTNIWQVDVSRAPVVVEITADAGYQTEPSPAGPTLIVPVPSAAIVVTPCAPDSGTSTWFVYRWTGAILARGGRIRAGLPLVGFAGTGSTIRTAACPRLQPSAAWSPPPTPG